MRLLLILYSALLSLALAGCQTSYPTYPTGIYRTAAELRQQQPSLPGTQARTNFFHSKLLVTNPDGAGSAGVQRLKVPADSAWGYANGGRAYRVCRQGRYRGEFRVEQRDTLTVYSRPEGKTVAYYVSVGLHGPLVPLYQRALRRAFADNSTFLASLARLRWYESSQVAVRVPTGGWRFRVVDFYRQSLGLPPAVLLR